MQRHDSVRSTGFSLESEDSLKAGLRTGTWTRARNYEYQARLHKLDADSDCENYVALNRLGSDTLSWQRQGVEITAQEELALMGGQWYFEAITSSGGRIMGGAANGWRLWPATVNFPNRFLTLETAGEGDYVERDIDLEANGGFIIDVHFQIAENDDYPGPGLRLSLLDDDVYETYPMMQVSVYHYNEADIQQENTTDAKIDLEVDLNGDHDYEDPNERYVDDEHPGRPSNFYFRSDIFDQFAPISQPVAWYQIVFFVQRDLQDGLFDIGAHTKMEGVQVVPGDARLRDVTDTPFNPTRLRLEPINEYGDPTHLRLDDITVVRLESN